MKILFILGTPKKELSKTRLFVDYIIKHFPDYYFEIISVRNENIPHSEFQSMINQAGNADGIIWAYPVYNGMVPSGMKKFIELIFENNCENAFEGKCTLNICTSLNFSDFTAINYMHAICDDLKMNYVDDFSINAHPPFQADQQMGLIKIVEYFIFAIKNNISMPVHYPVIKNKIKPYTQEGLIEIRKTENYNVVIITDADKNDSNLNAMIDTFLKSFKSKAEILNLNTFQFSCNCLGCLTCGHEDFCIHNDDFIKIYNQSVRNKDAIIYAGTIKDRFISAKMKMFFDREFFNNHLPVHLHKQMAFLISGNLKDNPNINTILSMLADFREANLIGIITDEYDNSRQITTLIQNLAGKIMWAIDNQYSKGQTFFRTGFVKIARDMSYHAKHLLGKNYMYYKKAGRFRFPNNYLFIRFYCWIKSLQYKLSKNKIIINKQNYREAFNRIKSIILN